MGDEKYYIVKPENIAKLENVNLKFEGTLSGKPVIESYGIGFDSNMRYRVLPIDHGHRTRLVIDDINVYVGSPLHLRRGEKVTVWGKIKDRIVQAWRIEGEEIIYQEYVPD